MSWLDKVPDSYAVDLRTGKINYEEFLELTKPYRTEAIQQIKKKTYKGFDLIG